MHRGRQVLSFAKAMTIEDLVRMVFVVPAIALGGLHVVEVYKILQLVRLDDSNVFTIRR